MTTFAEARPDLKKYYKPELNDGKLMSYFSIGSHKKIVLCCDKCGALKEIMPHTYRNLKLNFKCSNCSTFKFNYPELYKNEYHHEKNKSMGISCEKLSKFSSKNVWWKCEKGHEWKTPVVKRTNYKAKCPYCIGYYVTEESSLQAVYPELAKEWHTTKNKIEPKDVSHGTHKKYWWLGKCGHEWEASVSNRTRAKTNCPACVNSKGEKYVANFLTEIAVDYISQYPVRINGYLKFFDFYLPDYKLFIEVHGKQHFETVKMFNSRTLKEQQEIDKQKQQYAEKHGYYMMIDYREHDPELALERFETQFNEFIANEKEVV